MLFLSGIFVVVVYFARVSSYLFKVVVGVPLVLLFLFFTPLLTGGLIMSSSVSVIYNINLLLTLAFLLVILLGLILFSRYILSGTSAMRGL